MARTSKSPRATLQRKRDKLDWQNFNFLENLLIFCAQSTRSVPKESGVHFQIGSQAKENAVCVLFKIDRGADPLMRGAGVKPDYLVLYAASDRCICTIVEMKGKDEKNIEHGISQIKALRDCLRREIDAHLPHRCKRAISFQGILLTPIGSQIPGPKLEREKKAGLTILPLQYHQKAELFPYVSDMGSLGAKYVHRTVRRDGDEFNFIEKMLIGCALSQRCTDAFHAERFPSNKRDRQGIYINYKHPATDTEYAALTASNDGAAAAFSSQSFMRKVQGELARLGLVGLATRIIPGAPA